MSDNKYIQYLKPGTILKSKERDYKIVKVLGSGSFGITYLATATIKVGTTEHIIKFAIKEHFPSMSCYRGEDGCTVKCTPAAKKDVEDSRSDFLTEANRLKKLCLKSRNIVSVNEAFEDNDTAYYVMEYLDGGCPTKTSEVEAVNIVCQLADALKIIHLAHVLHLDVKPDNIVMKKDNKGISYPVLIDFGVSKHFTSTGKPTSKLGAKGASDGYAPQEQYGDIDSFSPKYDVYALGAVLFYLITGKNPPKAFKISPNQAELKALIPENVTERTKKTILGAMAPTAFERIPDMDAFFNTLLANKEEFLRVNPDKLIFPAKAASASIKVEGSAIWEVQPLKGKWWNVKKTKEGLEITVKENDSPESRDGIIQILMGNLSKTVQIEQQKIGTVIFPRKNLWKEFWEKRGKTILNIGGGVFAASIIIGGYYIVKPKPLSNSARLTNAIEKADGEELRIFAEADSSRAFLPFAHYLSSIDDKDSAIIFATKALSYSDSIKALSFLETINLPHQFTEEFIENNFPEINDSLTKPIPEKYDENVVATVLEEAEFPHEPTKVVQPQEVPTKVDQPQEVPTKVEQLETKDQKFERATKNNDLSLLLSLANDGYKKAYYPLANLYFGKGDKKNAKKWAQKAVSSNTDKKQAQKILDKIDPPIPEKTNEQLFAEAKTINDYKKLADKGYAKAYAPLATLYLKAYNYEEANNYATKALKSKVNISEAENIVHILEAYGFYDDGRHVNPLKP